ncbi:MAG: hypothetical protein ACJ739_00310, partial [Acidimicrobiales bacterium]
MSTDLERQIAGFAEALDREASAISFDDVIGRRTVAVDVEPPASDRATHVDSAPWLDATPGRDEVDHHDVLIELAPAVIVRGPESRRLAWKIALGAAAVAMLVVVLTAIQRGDDDPNPAVGLPELTTTFVSPRNGFSIRHPDGARVTPAMEDGEDGFDIVDVGSGTTFEGTSTENTDWHQALIDEQGRSITQDERIDEYLSADGILPGGCGVPRRQQAAITIDGRSGRIAECPHRIEATVVAGG